MANTTISQLVEKRVLETPNDIAVLFEGESLTFDELNNKANRLANYLIEHYQPRPDSLIPLLLKRDINMIVVILAVLKAGAGYIPISPAWPRDRIDYILKDSAANLVITQHECLSHLESVLNLTDIQLITTDMILASTMLDSKNPSTITQAHHLVYAIYTSGSTGQPKGVLIEHASVVNHLAGINEHIHLKRHENFLALSAYTFDISVLEMFLPLLYGGYCVIASENEILDSQAISRLINENQIAATQATPALWQLLLSSGCQLPEKLKILCGGEALTKPIAEMLLEQVEGFWNVYGPTETTIWATIALICRGMSLEDIPIGKPLHHIITSVIDNELYIAGDCLSRGYLNNPELTNERFSLLSVDNQPARRFYRTGDMVRLLPDGNLSFVERVDNQIKINGFRIEPGEIEFHLLSHPDIAQAIVFVQDINGLKIIVACVVGAGKITLNVDAIYSWVKNKLPDYMLPSAYYQFMSFPLTAHGKIDYRQLKLDILSKQPLSNDYLKTETKTEATICNIWTDVLKLNHQIGRNDHFFYLGGHSLQAAQVVARVADSLNIHMRVSDVYEHPTVQTFSEYVDQLSEKYSVNTVKKITVEKRIYNEPSFAQERMWFVDQQNPDISHHHITSSINIKGTLNVQLLDRAFLLMIKRHSVLRTVFIKKQGQLVQKIQPVNAIQSILETFDCYSMEKAEIQNRMKEDVKRPFSLDSGPLIRAGLYCSSEDDHLLVITIHHIICDKWSLHVIAKEVSHYYNVLQGMPLSPLPPLAIQYSDFSRWQRQTLMERHENNRQFWIKQLADLPALELPLDDERPLFLSFDGDKWTDAISHAQSKQFTSFAQKHEVSLFTLFFTAFSVLCSRYSGQTDFAIGTPVAGRNHVELEPLIGAFINTLTLRVNLSGAPACDDLLKQHQKTLFEALNHQYLPFEQVVEAVNPPRDSSRTPLFQVMMVMQNTPAVNWAFGKAEITPVNIHHDHSQFDLTFILEEGPSGINCEYIFNRHIFRLDSIKRMAAHLRLLMKQMIADPSKKIDDLVMLSREENHQLCMAWNGKKSSLLKSLTLPQIVERNVMTSPDAIALMMDNERLSYLELNNKSNQLAHYLSVDLSIKQGSLIPIFVDRSFDMIIAILAVLKLGCAYVPIDARYPISRVVEIIKDSNASIVLSHSHLSNELKQVEQDHYVNFIDLDRLDYSIYSDGMHHPSITCNSHDTAYVIYTSGSTGKPKGVMVHHAGVVNTIMSQIREFEITPESRILQFASFGFDSAVSEIFRALLSGATLVLSHPDQLIPGETLADTIHRQQITVLTQTPAALALLPIHACRTLKTLITAGEACPVSLMQKWADKVLFINAYGPTEASICATIAKCHVHDTKLPIGKPLDNVNVYVLDAAHHPVPVNVWGELYIGGVGVATGYLNQPALTEKAFLLDPFESTPNARMYKTGDRVRWLHDGTLEYGGRYDNQIKIRGFRIEPGEIEETLKQHPIIKEAVVLKRTINQDNKLIAYLVAQDGAINRDHEIRIFLRDRLPNYMVPDRFVYIDSIPLTSNRKIDREQLLRLSVDNQKINNELNVAITPIEKQLIAIFERLLGHKNIPIHESFFDIGGHSLLLVQLAMEIESVFSKKISLGKLAANNAISDIAYLIHNQSVMKDVNPVIALHEKDKSPPVYLIHETTGVSVCYMALAKELNKSHAVYAIQDPTIDTNEKFNSLKEMCKSYVLALKKRQESGPYILIGWCMGGMIAFEMACQLANESIHDVSVILIDTPADVSGNISKKSWQEEYDDVKSSFIQDSSIYHEAYIHRRVTEIMHRIDLMRRHKPAYFSGKAHLICAETVREEINTIDRLQWKKIARNILIHKTSGDHFSMIKNPNARKLANKIITLLNSTQRDDAI